MPKSIRTITTAELKAAALLAHSEGRLTAQHPEGYCFLIQFIDGKVHNCAIGATMTPEEIKTADSLCFSSVTGLHDKVVRFEDTDFANKLQIAHDNWTNHKSYKPLEQEFLELLQ